jgi:hypothetical protein
VTEKAGLTIYDTGNTKMEFLEYIIFQRGISGFYMIYNVAIYNNIIWVHFI